MSSIGTGYDLSASQFSPDGRIFQIEYAQKAVDNAGTAVALRGKDGVVFAVEKLVTSKLHEKGANRRIFSIDRHIGCAVAGLIADARAVVQIGRDEAHTYRKEKGQRIPVKYLKDRVSMYLHAYTLYSALRPFGTAVLMGSWDPVDGAELYCLDPSGSNHGYFGCAIGKAKQAAKTEMEKIKFKDMSCRNLIREAAKVIYIVHDEIKDKAFELELSWITEDTKGRHEAVPDHVFKEAEEYARLSLRHDSDSEDEEQVEKDKTAKS